VPIRRNSPLVSLILAMALLSVCARAIAQPSATDETLETLIGRFWQAQTEEERSSATEALLAKNLEARSVFRALAAAKLHTSDVATGVVRASRTSDSGLELPYAVLVPTSYDPAKRYPVEFMLHGGVGRPAWQDNEDFWRRGYDNLLSEDRITVVPAAWRDAIWWQEEQARNLPAILRQVKRDYSVDDNRVTMTGVSHGGTGAYFFAF
jgi:poly(3-hydroxybutyrate) depolymerase